jgi:outer membrane protein OmpA-like peptidoglycan-associated protein
MFYTFAKPYTARGNEKYLIIGRFVNPINDNIYRTYHYYNEGKRKALETARIVHSHQLLYTPVSDWGVSKNKQYRMYKKRRRIWDKWYNQQVDSINKVFAPILDTIPKPSRYESYDTRYYFDNISLIRTSSDEPVDEVSEPVITNTEPEVKTDITYTLQHVVFDTDKSELKPESVEELNYIIELMQRYTDYNIHLTGHTDSINNEAYNLKLSSDRAKACALYLTQNGIDKSRVTYEGKGESQPVAPNSTEEGRQMNRRVEFVFRRK